MAEDIVAQALARDSGSVLIEPSDRPLPFEIELPDMPALAQVTMVAPEAEPVAEDDANELRQAVSSEAIEAIEADIASLIATIDLAAGPETAEVPALAAPAESIAEDEEDATLVLLSELDRLWRRAA